MYPDSVNTKSAFQATTSYGDTTITQSVTIEVDPQTAPVYYDSVDKTQDTLSVSPVITIRGCKFDDVKLMD